MIIAVGEGRCVIGRRVIHRDVGGTGHRQAHREDRVDGAGVAFGHRDVIDGNSRHAVVVDDRGLALGVGDGCVGRAGEVDEERFVRLKNNVPDDVDRGGRARLAGTEAHRAIGGNVIRRSRRCAVHSGIVERDAGITRIGQAQRESKRRRATIAFIGADVIDADRRLRVVIGNRDNADGVARASTARTTEVDEERFVRLKL